MTEEKMRLALRNIAAYAPRGDDLHFDAMIEIARAALSTKQEAGEVSRSQTAQALEEAAKVADEHRRKAEEQLKNPAEPMSEVMAWLFETAADTAADIAISIRALSLPAPDGGRK